MKLLTNLQLKEVDRRTIEEEQITSLELMERAATVLTDAVCQLFPQPRIFKVFAGPGNNGGDALAMSRLLSERGYKIEVCLFNTKGKLSDDCQTNAERLLDYPDVSFTEVTSQFTLLPLQKGDVVIDGLFGSGINKPLEGGFAALVKYINASQASVISIDMPSGLMCEDNTHNISEHIIKADITLTIQLPKLAFFFPENQQYIGEWFSLDIRLSTKAINEADSKFKITKIEDVQPLLKPRSDFAHKGNFGHGLLIAGSYGMAGASILAARASFRSGIGLLTIHAPRCNNHILQASVPEAMVHHDENETHFATPFPTEKYQSIAIGPGLGVNEETAHALAAMLKSSRHPLVIDADALNLLAVHKTLYPFIPKGSILTPHPKELERLVGRCNNSYERLIRAQELAERLHVNIILKGAWTAVITPQGFCRLNPTGNPGMATGGCGDILTGILLALLSQGFSPEDASLLGVYIHGVAGDMAADQQGEISMNASDIINYLPKAWKQIEKNEYLCCAKEQRCL